MIGSLSGLDSCAARASECFLELNSARSPWETEQDNKLYYTRMRAAQLTWMSRTGCFISDIATAGMGVLYCDTFILVNEMKERSDD